MGGAGGKKGCLPVSVGVSEAEVPGRSCWVRALLSAPTSPAVPLPSGSEGLGQDLVLVFGRAGDWTQGLAHAWQVFYPESPTHPTLG